ncbi:MarR family transcriptional regulator [Shewanella avicenniae]|uniref:MarR family transcriptional regulator n=1 Tax=Shewanella avicenniae TaxID=2814294 RepID=A0ABX7QKM5_9GAMM|nr:MarR family transcriptional regulator [Shewanella avicenniae]QSX32007.1 MarR family transcriptional regulator [Shewanella avicenniae]
MTDTPIQQEINHAIVEFYERLSSWEQSVVRDQGVSLAQVHAVEILGAHGSLRMKSLAEKLGVTTGTLTVLVDRLVKNGLVVRQPAEDDRRAIEVLLTAKGQQMFEEHDKLHLQLTKEMLAVLTDTECQQFLTFLTKINRAI